MALSRRELLISASAASLVSACGGGDDRRDAPALPQSATTDPLNPSFPGPRNQYSIALGGSGGVTITSLAGSAPPATYAGAQALVFSDFVVDLGIGAAARKLKAADLRTLIELYVAFFNRVPEAAGLRYWVEQFGAGVGIDAIADAFYSAAVQYSAVTGYSASMTNADFVAVIYRNVLGRTGTTAPSADELNYWAGRLASGQATRGSLIRFMLDSAYSFVGDATWGWVPALLDNKFSVALYFAVQQGLGYSDAQANIVMGGRVAAAVTPTDMTAALALIGVQDAGFDLYNARYPSEAPIASGALVSDTYNVFRWSAPSATNTWNVPATLHDNGMEWIRMWTTTRSSPELRQTTDWYSLGWKDEYWSCLEVSGAILLAGARQGMRQRAVLFLSDESANAGVQLRPAAWSGLAPGDLLAAVQANATATAAYYKSLGLDIEVFEIGNEIDFGLCGVRLGDVPIPAGVDPVNDPDWMMTNVWSKMVPIINAAIAGLRAVYPNARICLHIAGFGYSKGNLLAVGFFKAMMAAGVPFDIAGFSYPYLIVPEPVLPQPYFAQPEFLSTLKAVRALGLQVEIVEFNYPADPTAVVQAHNASTSYTLTPAGQANFVRDLAFTVRGVVDAIFAWYPDYYPHFNNDQAPAEGSCGMFSANGVPRPALAVFKGF